MQSCSCSSRGSQTCDPNGSQTWESKSKIRPPGSNINVDEFEVIKELFYKAMALDKTMFNVNEDDVERHVPFNLSW